MSNFERELATLRKALYLKEQYTLSLEEIVEGMILAYEKGVRVD